MISCLRPTSLPLKAHPRLLFRLYNTEAKRKYPIGVSDYKEIKEDNYFHWDRTMFVKEFYEDQGKSVLILRPRRWAKSTTLSMAKYFFNRDINNPELAKKLFRGTKIEEEKEFVSRTQGQFPVISLSFGVCRASNFERMEILIREQIYEAYQEHSYLEDGDFLGYGERKEFRKIIEREPSAVYETALKTLSRLLHRYHRKRVIVLVDEYDVPINEAYLSGYYDSVIKYLTSMFTNTMKDNPYLEKGLLTGVLRVAKSGFLSGLNNLSVYSFLDTSYADIYGVQEQELKEALEYEGLADKMDEVRRYYNGYSTATSSNLYNPWSIINYLAKKQLKPYWVETGRTDFLANTIWSSPSVVRDNIQSFLNGDTILVSIETDVNYQDIKSSTSVLWSLLYFSGYLTGELVNRKSLSARVPNIEVQEELLSVWGRLININFGVQYSDLISALFTGNEKVFETQLRTLALELFSAHDLGHKPEAWYHGFIFALVWPLNDKGFRVETNREGGYGRPDIVLHSLGVKPNIIIELKAGKLKSGKDRKSEDVLRPLAKKGLDQIREQEYFRCFRNNNQTILCSIAFAKKFVAVSMEKFKREPTQLTQSSQPTQSSQKHKLKTTRGKSEKSTELSQPTQSTQSTQSSQKRKSTRGKSEN